MSISRTGKIYYTKSQLQAARQCNALEYARAAGYDLVKHSATSYQLKEHDSMVFTDDGFWNWNSRDLHGRALEFIMHYEGRSLPMGTVFTAVCAAAIASGIFTKLDGNQSVYDILRRQMRYQKEQQSYHYVRAEKEVYILEKKED